MCYFALKIISWSEWAYESNCDQTGYNTLPEQAWLPKQLHIEVNACETTDSNFKAISIMQV